MIPVIRPLVILLLALIVEMSVDEFLSVQELSDRLRRARFALPHTCKPALTAIKARRGRVQVLVTCPAANAGDRAPRSAGRAAPSP